MLSLSPSRVYVGVSEMKTKIRQRDYQTWDKKMQKRLMALTLRETSGMKDCLKQLNAFDADHKTFVLFEEREPVAWALTYWDSFNEEYDVMVYTRRDRRNKGYGRRLIKQAINWCWERRTKYAVFPDSENKPFFDKVDKEIKGAYHH